MIKKSKLFAITIIIIVLLLGIGIINGLPLNAQVEDTTTLSNNTLEVIFLDVGQGDSILLKTGDHNMLIDAGDIGKDSIILNYLAKYNVTSLDYIVATHPHADHIGSMPSVIRKMDNVGTIIMPDKTHTTKAFENLLNAIEDNDIAITIPKAGDNFTLGNASVQILAPNSGGYSDINDYSIVLRVEFGETAFLFTGDAGSTSEAQQMSNGLTLESDVLKVGHHGSRTSSSQRYLDAVSPNYAVISSGAGNTYGHPHSELLSRLNAMGVTIYRTDLNGTIVFTSDGKEIFVSSENKFYAMEEVITESVYIMSNN